MSRTRSGSAVVALIVAALIVVGCGGDPVTHSGFGRDAARLCAQANAEARHLRTSAPDPDAAEVTVLVIEMHRVTLDDLQDLDPPTPDRAAVERWLAVIDQMLDEAELASLAHAAGDTGAFDDATERATLLDGRARDLARELDVHEPCRLPAALRSRSATDPS